MSSLEADVAERAWLASHGPEAGHFLNVDHTIRTRDAIEHHIHDQLEAHHREPILPPHLEQDLGLDLGP